MNIKELLRNRKEELGLERIKEEALEKLRVFFGEEKEMKAGLHYFPEYNFVVAVGIQTYMITMDFKVVTDNTGVLSWMSGDEGEDSFYLSFSYSDIDTLIRSIEKIISERSYL